MIPLKSFSKPFRAPVDSEDIEQLPEMNSGIVNQPRIPREPFRNLPRVQERRERNNIDLQVEEIVQEQPAAKPRTSASTPAPIINSESIKSSAPVTTATKSATKPASPKPVVAGSSKTTSSEIQIESNSTSRRTAMESDSTPVDPALATNRSRRRRSLTAPQQERRRPSPVPNHVA